MDTTNLVFTSAGNQSKHVNYWLREPEKRNFDLWVVYYPEGEPPCGYADNTELFLQRRGSKYENLAYVYDNFRDRLNKYDAFFIVDDDIEISTLAINKLFEIHARWKLDLSQPPYSLQSCIVHPHLVWRPFSTLRFVAFVENSVTVFRRETFHACVPIFRQAKSGWGIDHIFPKCIPHGNPRIAVIDDVVCHHPFRQSELDRYYLPRHLHREEGEKLMNKYGIALSSINRFDLKLMSVSNIDDLLNKGRNLIIAALVSTNLHIRIFDTDGKKVVDKVENKLNNGKTLIALKNQLNLLAEKPDLSQEQKLKFMRDAIEVADIPQRNLVLSYKLKNGYTPQFIQKLLFKLGDALIWRWLHTSQPSRLERTFYLLMKSFAAVFFSNQSWITTHSPKRLQRKEGEKLI